ncbi:MAG: PaaI family thioesterase [Deltaproteobacteria bacterium]|nr:PaaI family thioesterase [Deltaproteobacteria bacterium]
MTLKAIQAFFRKDLFAGFVGIELIEACNGRARARLPIGDRHRNGLGLVHGGAIFTLADLAFAAAVNSRGRAAVAIHCSISYLKAAAGDVLFAEAEEVSCGPKIAAYTIRITDAPGEIIARFEGMAYRKKDHW